MICISARYAVKEVKQRMESALPAGSIAAAIMKLMRRSAR